MVCVKLIYYIINVFLFKSFLRVLKYIVVKTFPLTLALCVWSWFEWHRQSVFVRQCFCGRSPCLETLPILHNQFPLTFESDVLGEFRNRKKLQFAERRTVKTFSHGSFSMHEWQDFRAMCVSLFYLTMTMGSMRAVPAVIQWYRSEALHSVYWHWACMSSLSLFAWSICWCSTLTENVFAHINEHKLVSDLICLPVAKEVDRSVHSSLNNGPAAGVVSLVTPDLHQFVGIFWLQ